MPLLPTPHFAFSGSSTLPPAGSHILITDTLNASADFAIYHLVLEALRAEVQRKVVVVDFAGGRKSAGHWEAIGKRLGSPIPLKQSDGFSIITPSCHDFLTTSSTSPSLYTEDEEPTLRNVYRSIQERVDEGALIVLDDLSELLFLGFPTQEVARFVRAVMSLARKHNHIIVSHIHADTLASSTALQLFQPNDPDAAPSDLDLLLRLIRLGGGVWWRIEGLRTGRSGVVTGEISSHPLIPLPTDARTHESGKVPVIPRSHPLQYRMEDSGIKTFAKGTGEGYL